MPRVIRLLLTLTFLLLLMTGITHADGNIIEPKLPTPLSTGIGESAL